MDKYNEALERAKKAIIDCGDNEGLKKMIKEIFPELAESEDERTRKDIIVYLTNELHNVTQPTPRTNEYKKWIAYLEKQGEPIDINPSEFDSRLNKLLKQFEILPKVELESSLAFYLNVVQEGKQDEQKPADMVEHKRMTKLEGKLSSLVVNAVHRYCEMNNLESPHFVGLILGDKIAKDWSKEILESAKKELEKVEQKPAENANPKFKVGDWVVYKNDICQIVKREEGCNKLITVFGIEKELVNERNLSTARLWTIQDAKDGDVLATSAGAFIYNGNNGGGSCPGSYCGIDTLGRFKTGLEHHWTAKKVYPATKEQRTELLLKMHEAGYEWDAVKKELKKIEQKPIKVPKFKAGDFIQFNGMGHTRYTVKEVCGLSHYINTFDKRMDMSYTDSNFELVEQKPEQHKYLSPKKAIDEGGAEGLSDFEKKVRGFLLDFHAEFSNGMSYSEVRNAVIGLITMFELHKPAEWSEEDEKTIRLLIAIIETNHKEDAMFKASEISPIRYLSKNEVIERIKSLRPQKHWKPTEEQMEALKQAAVETKGRRISEQLSYLYIDLKKL